MYTGDNLLLHVLLYFLLPTVSTMTPKRAKVVTSQDELIYHGNNNDTEDGHNGTKGETKDIAKDHVPE